MLAAAMEMRNYHSHSLPIAKETLREAEAQLQHAQDRLRLASAGARRVGAMQAPPVPGQATIADLTARRDAARKTVEAETAGLIKAEAQIKERQAAVRKIWNPPLLTPQRRAMALAALGFAVGFAAGPLLQAGHNRQIALLKQMVNQPVFANQRTAIEHQLAWEARLSRFNPDGMTVNTLLGLAGLWLGLWIDEAILTRFDPQ